MTFSWTLWATLILRGGFPLWVIVLLAMLAPIGAFYLYFRETVKIDFVGRIVLASLRTLTLWLILFLLLKPVLLDELLQEKVRPFAVILDNSQSMLQQDPRLNAADRIRVEIARGNQSPDINLDSITNVSDLSKDTPSRAEMVRAVLANPKLNLQNKLLAKTELLYFLFGQKLRGVGDSPENPWLESFKADDTQTLLNDALNEYLQKDEIDLPSGIILITDGRDTASKTSYEDLGRLTARLKVPFYIYGVGGSSAGYLQLKDVPVPETLFVDDLVRVPFRWRARGFKEGDLELSLTLNGKPVGKPKIVSVQEGDDIHDSVTFVPSKIDSEVLGKQELTANIRLVQGEQVLNDHWTKMVRVVDRKVRLLYIENLPRWEFKFIQQNFLRDRRVEPSFYLVDGDLRVMQSGPPFIPQFPTTRKELFSYDLLVIGDVKASFFTSEQRDWIREFVAEGGGLVMISGRQYAPASYLETTLAEILPVEFKAVSYPIDDNARPKVFYPVLTPFGVRSGLMSLGDTEAENQEIWRGLPGWYWHYPVTKLRPGAVSLLDHPSEKLEKEDKLMPLIAMQYYGKGSVLFMASDETWRWRYNVGNRYFGRYWGQVIYQFGLAHAIGGRTSQISLAQGEAILGKPTQVYARLFNNEFRPLTTPSFVARLEQLDAPPGQSRYQSIRFEAVPNQPGEYVATLTNDHAGRFLLKIDTGSESTNLDYRVELPSDHELAPNSMNETMLRFLADQSGGKFYREENLHTLVNDLQIKKTPYHQRKEILLWNEWWVLLIVIGMFSLEWLLRKFTNLS